MVQRNTSCHFLVDCGSMINRDIGETDIGDKAHPLRRNLFMVVYDYAITVLVELRISQELPLTASLLGQLEPQPYWTDKVEKSLGIAVKVKTQSNPNIVKK